MGSSPNDCKQKLESINVIRETFQHDAFVDMMIEEFVSEIFLNEFFFFTGINMIVFFIYQTEFANKITNDHTVDVDFVIKNSKSVPEFKLIDNAKILQSILSRRLQPEQFNAVINMVYAMRPSATSQEVEEALVISLCSLLKLQK